MTDLSSLTFGVPQAATATLAVLLVVPLAFLARPCRATLLWTLALVVTAASVFAVLSADLTGTEWLRRSASGVMLSATVLLWSGLRAWRGVRPLVWLAPALAVVGAGLGVVPDDLYSLGFRIVFYLGSVFAGLSAVELRRLPERDTPALIPLVVLCTLFAALGLAVLVGGFLAPAAAGDFQLVRAVNAIGVIAFIVCALLAMVTLAAHGSPDPATAAGGEILRTGAERLRRARARAEDGWAVLAVHLDDAAELSLVSGRERFTRLVDRFEEDVTRALPADADIGAVAPGRLLVFLNRPTRTVRRIAEDILESVGDDADASGFVRLSASIGWCPAGDGDDARALASRAQAAAGTAATAGGNRVVQAAAV